MMDFGKVLVTGGSGLLGRNLRKLIPDSLYPSRAEFDVTDLEKMRAYLDGKDVRVVLHAAAFTSPPKINENPAQAVDANIAGTCNVVKACMEKNIKLLYMCTDYVFKGDAGMYKEDDPVFPVNKYAWSKLGGECAVRMYDNSLVIRASFGDVPFPYEKAFVDQWTSRLAAGEIAKRIVALIESDMKGAVHVGGKRQTVYEYARSVSPEKNIGTLSLKDVTFTAPKDTSLDTSLFDSKIMGKN
jgi:dTDP-4-dehydrorhamnose reductase